MIGYFLEIFSIELASCPPLLGCLYCGFSDQIYLMTTLVQSLDFWRKQLPELTAHPIPSKPLKDRLTVQLHGFSDAGKIAYAGVCSLHTDYKLVSTSLVISKIKIPSLSSPAIKKLELCGTHLFSKLLSNVQDVLRTKPTKNIKFWGNI